jgi:hypothetical protein
MTAPLAPLASLPRGPRAPRCARLSGASLLLALALFGAPACGPSAETVQVRGTPASPATDGEVSLTPDARYGNAKLVVRLTHVTPAERLSPTARTFVVWARRGGAAQRLGTLAYDPQSREASFEATVTPGPFELLVSAETSADAAEPSPYVLLTKPLGAGR